MYLLTLSLKHQHHLPNSVLEVALQSTFTSVVTGKSFVKLRRNQEGDLYLLENFGKSKLMLWRALLPFKVIQFIVLPENKEGDPIFRINFRKKKHIQNGRGRKNVLSDDMAQCLKFVNSLFYWKTKNATEANPFKKADPIYMNIFRKSKPIQDGRNRGKCF